MYIILNAKLERIGALSNRNNGATPFYNDQITQQIADGDQQLALSNVPDNTNAFNPNGNSKNWGHTLNQIFIPYGFPDTHLIKEGNSLAYRDPNSKHWYIMRLTSVMDATDNSGNHYKEATGVNLCIWKLGKTIHYPMTIHNANSRTAFRNLFMNTGWFVNPHSDIVGGSSDIQFDGQSSSQAQLQQFCQLYGAEIDAYVLFPSATKVNGQYYSANFQVAEKRVDIKRRLGSDKGDRIVYGRNATNIQRTVIDDSLYTRLYVYGKNGSTCACSITHDLPYVEDRTANEFYNPKLGDNAENFLEGAITSQTMDNPQKLAKWGVRQLRLFNHPRANYTVTATPELSIGTGNNMVMDATLGDTFRIIDEKMDPVLHAEARVIQKQLSFATPAQNTITLGEYTTVNVVPPNFISNLQQGISNHVSEILAEIHRNPRALSCTIDKPDGCSWKYGENDKKFIAHIYVMGEDITSYIDTKGFIWKLYQNHQINHEFIRKHAGDGQTLTIQNDLKINQDMVPKDSDADNNGEWTPPDKSDDHTNSSDTNDSEPNKTNSDSDKTNSDSDPDTDSDSDSGEGLTMRDGSSDEPSDTSADDNPSGEGSFDLFDQITDGTDDITGTVQLVIDTDYIEDKQSANFNTRKSKHLFTVGQWTDLWNDPRVGALQYINYNPKDGYYYGSLVYYGRWRPRQAHHKKKNGGGSYGPLLWDQSYDPSKISTLVHRMSNTEIVKMDKDGHYIDSMILPFSHHNSNFGLDYTHTQNGEAPYIWTTYQEYPFSTNKYHVVRIQYQPGTIAAIQDLDIPATVNHVSPLNIPRVKEYAESGCMVNYDNSSDMVLFSHDDTNASPNHEVDFYKAQDLLNQKNSAQPVKKIYLTDYGFVPKMEDYSTSGSDPSGSSYYPDDQSSRQTYQSCCLHYPYFFFDSGNANMSDQRMVYCINVSSGTKIFETSVDPDELMVTAPNDVIGNNPGNYVFAEPETLNWTKDEDGNLSFLFGMNVAYENDKDHSGEDAFDINGIPHPKYQHFELLYQVGMDLHKSFKNGGSNEPDHTHGQPDQPDPK